MASRLFSAATFVVLRIFWSTWWTGNLSWSSAQSTSSTHSQVPDNWMTLRLKCYGLELFLRLSKWIKRCPGQRHICFAGDGDWRAKEFTERFKTPTGFVVVSDCYTARLITICSSGWNLFFLFCYCCCCCLCVGTMKLSWVRSWLNMRNRGTSDAREKQQQRRQKTRHDSLNCLFNINTILSAPASIKNCKQAFVISLESQLWQFS